MPSQWAGSTRRARLPRDWPAIRQRILKRDQRRCTWPGCGQPATDVDHIVAGDDHTDANLTSLCDPHHRAKSGREGAAARTYVSPRRPAEQHPGLRQPST